MRLNILWKLIFVIALPLLGIYIVLNWFEFITLREQAISDVKERVTRLATLYAQQFDGELSTISQVARSTAEFLTIDPDIGRQKPWTILEQNILQNSLIYGAALAWTPQEEDGSTILSSPYVYRDENGTFHRMDIGTDAYDYRTSEWFKVPFQRKEEIWTKPYFDEGAGNVLMSTFSSPIIDAEGKVLAITTVDLPLQPLQESMHLDELNNGTFIILSQDDQFISHPNSDRIMVSGIGDILEKHPDKNLKLLRSEMLAGHTGTIFLPRFIDGEAHWIAYAPIKGTGWSFAAAFPSDDILAPVYEDLARDVVIVLIGLAVNLAAIFIISLIFTRPIRRMATAMHAVTLGDMDTRVEGINTRDEFGDLARGFNEMVANLRTNIEDLATERAERHVVDMELNLAREIQTSLLPKADALAGEEAFDLYAENLPARHVAGDFYDYWMIDEHTLGFVIADVSGKGVPAAFFMAITRTLIRNLAMMDLQPDTLIQTVNEQLLEDNERSMFVTLFYGIYSTETGRLRYVNAGHMSPIRIPAEGDIEPVCPSTGTVLGAIPESTWTAEELILKEKDTLIFYTDGVTEAMDSEGTMLEEAGFIDFLTRLRHESSEHICRATVDFVHTFEEGEQGDDVTVLMLRRTKRAPGTGSDTGSDSP